MDSLTAAQRHNCMSHIKGRNTKPEAFVCNYLYHLGFRYRKNDKRLPGHPDIVLSKYKTVVFINGCFWHGHEGCKFFRIPKTNPQFWTAKIQRNKERDAVTTQRLSNMGWRVITIWECALRDPIRKYLVIEELVSTLLNHSFSLLQDFPPDKCSSKRTFPS